MPQLIQHIPIERDGVSTPQTLAPILDAAKPGTVTLVAANARDDSHLAQTLLTLSIELAKTRKTVFASTTYQRKSLQRRLAAAALGVSPYDVHSFANENPQRIAEVLDAVSKTSLSIATPFFPEDYNAVIPPSGGACVFGAAQSIVPDFAALDTDPAEWMSENATAHNVAVIAGIYLSANPDAPNAPLPGLLSFDRPFFENADAVFALHDERRR